MAGGTKGKINERLLSALIGLARATEGNEDLITEETRRVLFRGLSLVTEDTEQVENTRTECEKAHQLTELLADIREEKKRLVPNCFDCASPCGRTADYEMQEFWDAEEERVNLKLELVERLVSMAKTDKTEKIIEAERSAVCFEALIVLGWNGSRESLLRVLAKIK